MNALLWFLLGGLSFGSVFGACVHMLLVERVRARLTRELRNEAAGEARWARAPFVDNGGAVVDRRRSPDFKLVTRGQVRSPAQPQHHDL